MSIADRLFLFKNIKWKFCKSSDLRKCVPFSAKIILQSKRNNESWQIVNKTLHLLFHDKTKQGKTWHVICSSIRLIEEDNTSIFSSLSVLMQVEIKLNHLKWIQFLFLKLES